MREEADAIVFEATTDHGRLAGFGLEILPIPDDRPVRILTHCNTGPLACGQYGTALGIVQAAHHADRPVHVWVDETRPYLQGARLTTWELAQAGVPHALLPDVAAGHLMSLGEVDVVLVGADRVAANGDTANKVGTYPLAVLAARHGIPFYVCAPTSSVDLATPDGSAIAIEERSADEVLEFRGVRIAPPGTDVRNPAFDVTPAELITGIITEEGVLSGPFEPRAARRHRACARALGVDAGLPRDPAAHRPTNRHRPPSRHRPPNRHRPTSPPQPRSATDGHRRRRPARLDRHPRDDRQGPPALLPRARPAVRRLRHLRPRGARVRAHPLGDRLRARRADRARARVQRPDPAAALRDGPARTASRRSCAT